MTGEVGEKRERLLFLVGIDEGRSLKKKVLDARKLLRLRNTVLYVIR